MDDVDHIEQSKVRFIRMERPLTESYITFVLPHDMLFSEGAFHAERMMPGWEALCGCLDDPDNSQF